MEEGKEEVQEVTREQELQNAVAIISRELYETRGVVETLLGLATSWCPDTQADEAALGQITVAWKKYLKKSQVSLNLKPAPAPESPEVVPTEGEGEDKEGGDDAPPAENG